VRRRVAWPGVAVKTAKGRNYYYWTKATPWERLPDPARDPDGFMRKLAHLQRVALRTEQASAGTLANAIRLYRKHPDFTDRSASTQRTYGMYLDRLLEVFPAASLREITRPLVQRYVMDEHADTRGAANMMLRVLHNVFKWAGGRETGLIDPTVGIKEYDGDEYQPWPDHLLAAALASPDLHFRAAVALHLYTGQRTGDVCAMTWNALTEDGRIPVKQQKTGTALLIPIHWKLTEILAESPRGAIAMLTNRQGRPLKTHTFREWVGEFAEAHGTHLVPHGLRKNAVNALLEATCSTAEVSSITGQSLQMVEHYAKQRNQGRIATVAMGKWGAAQTENGKTFPNIENRASK
jgi:integrase